MRAPPSLARRLLAMIAPPHRRDAILGDLEEEFAERPDRAGAGWWYWRQVLGSAGPLLARRFELWRGEGSTSTRDRLMKTLLNDVRFGLRTLRKNRGFAALVIGTLALGIGANTIVYGVVDGVILHPYPVPEARRLVAVGTQFPKLGASDLSFVEHIAPAEYVDIRDASETLERIVAWDMGNRQVSFGDATENLFTGFWWGDGIETLGLEPHLGRGMTMQETLAGDPVAVLSHRVWETRFGADSTLVGGTILMNGSPFTVVGVLPPRIVLYGMDLWIPMGVSPEVFPRGRRQWQVMARVREGYDLQEVNAELDLLARRTESVYGAEFDEYEGWRLEALPWSVATTRQFRAASFLLLGAVGFVLVLVCSNVASLLLSRGSARRRELAVRTALGAGRRRIVTQLVTESVTVALLGGIVGVGVAWFGTRAAASVLARVPLLAGTVALNARVLAFTAAVSVLAGLLFGLFPALQAATGDLRATLHSEASSSTGSRGRFRLQRTLVGAEVALALLLLAGGGLFIHSLIRVNGVDTGFEEDGVLSMRLTLAREKYDGDAIRAFFQELEERVSGLPGVTSVAVGSQFPPVAIGGRPFQTPEMQVTAEGQLPVALTNIVSPGYFDALGIPLRAGRAFGDGDVAGTPDVAVVNEAAAELFFGTRDVVGRRIRPDPESEWIEIIGVVGNTANRGLDQPTAPEVFASHLQLPGWSNQLFLLVRSELEPGALLPAIRSEVRALDPEQPIYAIRTVEEAFAVRIASRRLAAQLLAVFAAFALLLAAVGIYGVVSFGVHQRTREIGVRMALGAGRGRVRFLMIRQGLAPVIVGAMVGLGGAIVAGGAVEGLLFELSGTDPATLAVVTLLLVTVACVAALAPAVRASGIDPARTLRQE